MSYLHCPTCACAYNVAREPSCPRCGLRAGTPVDPTDDIVSAVEQLARAMARATPTELAAAESVLDARCSQLALPAPGALPAPSPWMLRVARTAMTRELDGHLDSPEPLEPARPTWRALVGGMIETAIARLAPRLPARVTAPIVALDRVKSRMRGALRTLLAA